MIAQGLLLLAAYALGSVSGGLVLGRLRGVDIRAMGSGNAGGTNALRTLGWRFALGVVAVDAGKGALAAALPALAGATATLAPWCGLTAVAGHVWPVWHGFRGGKGGATGVGVLAVIMPGALIPVIAVWGIVLGLTGLVSLATMLAAVTVVPAAWWLAPTGAWPAYLGFAVAFAGLVVFAHRANVRRLVRGEEIPFRRARFLRRP